MAKTEYIIGRGTQILVAPLDCDLVFPESVIFTLQADLDPATSPTSITVSATTNTRTIRAYPEKPVYLLFTDPTTGREVSVKVIDDIEPGATTLTIDGTFTKREIVANSTAPFPVRLSARSAANLNPEDDTAEIESFDNDGWRDYIRTSLGQTLSCPGPYLPLDPGWLTSLSSRLTFHKIYAEIIFPKPTCDDSYTRGHRVYGAAHVTNIPIEDGAKAIITGNIDLQFCGKVTWEDPE